MQMQFVHCDILYGYISTFWNDKSVHSAMSGKLESIYAGIILSIIGARKHKV